MLLQLAYKQGFITSYAAKPCVGNRFIKEGV